MMRPAFFLAAIFMFLFFPSIAQVGLGKAMFEKVDVRDGLSQNSVLCIAQDELGYIWMGTEDGLNSYDGRQVKVYRSKSDRSTSIYPDNYKAMHIAKGRNFWMITAKSLTSFHPAFGFGENYGFGGDNWLNDMVYPGGDKIYIATEQGLVTFSISTKKHSIGNFPGGIIYSLLHLSDNKLLLCTDSGLIVYQPDKGTYRIQKNTRPMSHLRTVYKDSAGYVWVGDTDGHFFKITIQKDTATVLGSWHFPELGFIKAFYLDARGILWVGARHGLLQLDISSQAFLKYLHNPTDKYSLSKNNVECFLSDHSQAFWVGTYGGGVNVWSPYRYKFTTISHDPLNANSLSSNYILSFAEGTNNDVWIGTDGEGVDLWKRRQNLFTHYQTKSNVVLSILPSPDGQYLWLGTEKGVERLNILTRQSTLFNLNSSHDNPELGSGKIMFYDEQGNLYAGGDYGLFLMGAADKRFKRVELGHDYSVRDIKQLDHNHLLIATLSGLLILDTRSGHIRSYLSAAHNNGCYGVSSVVVSDGVIWCGLFGWGLFKMSVSGNNPKFISMADGLPNNHCYSLLTDKAGNVWVSSNNGIFALDKQEHISSYGIADGLQSTEFNGGSCCKLSTGELLFGGVNGFNIFDPAGIRSNPHRPQVGITGVKVMDKPLAVDSMQANRPLELPYNRNYMEFGFAAFDFISPMRNRYTYMLEGYDRSWSDTSGIISVRYHNLPPGSYTFRVNGTNNDGLWSREPAAFTFVINPPFWKTPLFVGALCLIIVLLVLYLVQRRISTLRKRDQLRSRMLEIENKALRAQMNPHFIFNSLNAIQNTMLEGKASEALKYLSKFSKLLRGILNHSDKSLVSLSEELNTLKLYLDIESLRFDHAFSYQLNIDPALDIDSIEIPPMMVQPFVENAIWHGVMHKEGSKKLVISCHTEAGKLVFTVDDNGIGRSQAATQGKKDHISHATRIIAERMTILYKDDEQEAGKAIEIIDKTDENGLPSGTLVIIRFPLNNS